MVPAFGDLQPCWGKVVTAQRDMCTFSEPEISMYDPMGIFGALVWALRLAGKGENSSSEEAKERVSIETLGKRTER